MPIPSVSAAATKAIVLNKAIFHAAINLPVWLRSFFLPPKGGNDTRLETELCSQFMVSFVPEAAISPAESR